MRDCVHVSCVCIGKRIRRCPISIVQYPCVQCPQDNIYTYNSIWHAILSRPTHSIPFIYFRYFFVDILFMSLVVICVKKCVTHKFQSVRMSDRKRESNRKDRRIQLWTLHHHFLFMHFPFKYMIVELRPTHTQTLDCRWSASKLRSNQKHTHFNHHAEPKAIYLGAVANRLCLFCSTLGEQINQRNKNRNYPDTYV